MDGPKLDASGLSRTSSEKILVTYDILFLDISSVNFKTNYQYKPIPTYGEKNTSIF